jgi:RNA polymerase sigma factor (sigma-70 family)
MSAVAGRTPTHVGALSDEELVKLARAGHEPAFDAIVHRYRAPLVSYCRRWLDAHRAEEVVQHTLMKAFLCVRDDIRPLAVRPWLYRVAHNAALNAVEKKGSDWEELDENYDGVPQPPQVAEQRARFLQIVDEIEALPPRQREALVLNEFEGRCYADIAAQLGTSESGVRGLLRRARRQLRETAAAIFLPIPVLREFVRSDGGRGAGELLGTAGAAGGVGAAGGFAKVAAGVLAAGTIAGGGTAIQQSDEPLRAPDAKAADVAKGAPAPAEDSVKTVLSETADEVRMAPSTVIRVTENRARLGADPGATTTTPPTSPDVWVGGIQTDPGKTAQPVEESDEDPLLPIIDDTPLTVDGEAEEPSTGETQAEEAPPAAEVQDGEAKQPGSSDQPSTQQQPGPEHAQESEPGSVTPELP